MGRTAGWKSINISNFKDGRGCISVIEPTLHDIQMRRAYFIQQVPQGKTRAKHAHRRSKNLVSCISGQFTLKLNNLTSSSEITMTPHSDARLIDPLVWMELGDFSNDAICLCISDQIYDPHDNIKDFDIYTQTVGERHQISD